MKVSSSSRLASFWIELRTEYERDRVCTLPDPSTEISHSDVLKRLRAEGVRARFTCLVVPVQLEGRLSSGERFYFRCRGRSCSLGIALKGGDPVGDPTWRQDITRREGADAGFLDPEEAESVFRELLAVYEAQLP